VTRVLVVALVLVLGACATSRPPPVFLPADARLYDPGAGPFVALDRYRGRVVVFDFWAGWCAECRLAIPQVSRLADAFATAGLVVVGVNAGESATDAAAYARELGIGYPIALDPDLGFSDRVGAGVPFVLVVDRNGAIAHRSRRIDPRTLGVIRTLLAPP
jgi:thiol-disulfide isomerase/thioredoxin